MRFIGNVEKDAQVRAVASGALSTGDTVVVNSDGTVSAVEVQTGSQTSVLGSTSFLTTGVNEKVDLCYHSGEDKVVAVYRLASDTYSGYAAVGTVSGGTISWGTSVKYNDSYTRESDICYDSANDKVFISYRDDGDGGGNGRARVGTVSGTSISYGSEFEWYNSGVYSTQAEYHSSLGKIGLAFITGGSVNGPLRFIVGEITGDSADFGSSVSLTSGTVFGRRFRMQPMGEDQFLITYNESSTSYYLTAVVATVSGNEVTLGTPTVVTSSTQYVSGLSVTDEGKILITADPSNSSLDGAYYYGELSGGSWSSLSSGSTGTDDKYHYNTVYDPKTGLFIGVYTNPRSSPQYQTYVQTISVSGSTLTFSSPTLFLGGSSDYPIDGWGFALALDADGKVIIGWHAASSDRFRTGVYRPAATTYEPNLTSENFIGFADSGYADGQSAAINSTCTVDRNQSGLTAGQKYYVQVDGTLGTTAADPSVEAGTAISSTEIIVKG